MEEGAGYGHGGPLLEAVDPMEGHSGAKYEETGESSTDSDEDSEIGFHMIGVTREYSDGEDWLVVEEI